MIFSELLGLPTKQWSSTVLQIPQYLFNHVVKGYKNDCTLKFLLWHMLCDNSNKKTKKLFVVSCPKLLCCQNTMFGPLGVNILGCISSYSSYSKL